MKVLSFRPGTFGLTLVTSSKFLGTTSAGCPAKKPVFPLSVRSVTVSFIVTVAAPERSLFLI